jgi:hypothetical protein
VDTGTGPYDLNNTALRRSIATAAATTAAAIAAAAAAARLLLLFPYHSYMQILQLRPINRCWRACQRTLRLRSLREGYNIPDAAGTC